MKRLIDALVFALLAVPLAAEAQPAGQVFRIGILGAAGPVSVYAGPDPGASVIRAFLQRMRDLGYVYGRDMVTEPRSTEGKLERFPALAAELVSLKVDVIVAPTKSAVQALKEATTTIPIVMAGVGDPVGRGLVASLARTGSPDHSSAPSLVPETGGGRSC